MTRRRLSEGQTLVETALILPILFLVIYYAAVIGIFGYDVIQIGNLAQRTAMEMAATGDETPAIDAHLAAAAQNAHLTIANMTICTKATDANGVDKHWRPSAPPLPSPPVPADAPSGLGDCHDAASSVPLNTSIAPGMGGVMKVTLLYRFSIPYPGGTWGKNIYVSNEETVLSYTTTSGL